jgi:hypothetical protein
MSAKKEKLRTRFTTKFQKTFKELTPMLLKVIHEIESRRNSIKLIL